MTLLALLVFGYIKGRFVTAALPLFRRIIAYDEVEAAELGRTTLLEGWGFHWSLSRGGWVWNFWGRDCVVLTLRRGELCLGTDDSQGLLNLLKEKLAAKPSQKSGE